jgi:hypothetical protein
MRNALLVCLTVGVLALSPASSVGSDEVTVVSWDFGSNGLLVEVDDDLGAGILSLTVCFTLQDGSQVASGIDVATNGHNSGRQSSGSGTAVSVSTGDLDTSRPDVYIVGDAQANPIVGICSVRASFTPAK